MHGSNEALWERLSGPHAAANAFRLLTREFAAEEGVV
jgi:hypothetical protein